LTPFAPYVIPLYSSVSQKENAIWHAGIRNPAKNSGQKERMPNLVEKLVIIEGTEAGVSQCLHNDERCCVRLLCAGWSSEKRRMVSAVGLGGNGCKRRDK